MNIKTRSSLILILLSLTYFAKRYNSTVYIIPVIPNRKRRIVLEERGMKWSSTFCIGCWSCLPSFAKCLGGFFAYALEIILGSTCRFTCRRWQVHITREVLETKGAICRPCLFLRSSLIPNIVERVTARMHPRHTSIDNCISCLVDPLNSISRRNWEYFTVSVHYNTTIVRFDHILVSCPISYDLIGDTIKRGTGSTLRMCPRNRGRFIEDGSIYGAVSDAVFRSLIIHYVKIRARNIVQTYDINVRRPIYSLAGGATCQK